MSDSIKRGDILHIVLDVFPVEDNGERCHRVQFRGVFPRGASAAYPPLAAGGSRNVIEVFFDVPHDVNVFLVGEGAGQGG